MKLTSEQRKILKEDVLALKDLIKQYKKEGKYDKQRACQIELKEIERKLRG